MEVDATVRVRQPETPGDGAAMVKTVLDISGDDLGILIGRRGETLVLAAVPCQPDRRAAS